MKEETKIKILFKENLGNETTPFSEQLWNKLNTDLIPVREAYHKKQKRRAIAYWCTAAMLLLGAGITATTLMNTAAKKDTPVVQTTTPAKHSCCEGAASTCANEDESSVEQATTTENTGTVTTANSKQKTVTEVNAEPTPKVVYDFEGLNSEAIDIMVKQHINRADKQQKVKRESKQISTIVANKIKEKEEQVEDAIVVQQTTPSATDNNDTKHVPKDIFKIDATKQDAVTNTPTTTPAVPSTTNIAKATSKKAKIENNKSVLQFIAGANVTSSFDKTGYMGGIMLNKSISGKNIFVGLKVASNKLDHQLLNIDKAGTTPLQADAIVEKMTTFQIPFGYQFALNKKATNPTMLNVGFEPTWITGLSTVYYDNNGVQGGPITMVRNSALIDKAINKFNVSFILGVHRRINNRLGFFANGGYGLINITDKQFYNKSAKANNLKYIQTGISLNINR